jgi:hypothetical protein
MNLRYLKSPQFSQGDRVRNMRKDVKFGRSWETGYIALIIPAGVVPLNMFNRYLKQHGVCKMGMAKSPMIHKERYIVCVRKKGVNYFYCPSNNSIEKLCDSKPEGVVE